MWKFNDWWSEQTILSTDLYTLARDNAAIKILCLDAWENGYATGSEEATVQYLAMRQRDLAGEAEKS